MPAPSGSKRTVPSEVPPSEPAVRSVKVEQRLRKDVCLGINVADLIRVNPHLRLRALRTADGTPKLDLEKVKTFGEAPDERFAEFKCDLLSAALAIDIIRNEGRVERSTICRAYIKRGETWSRLPFNAVLTRKESDHYVLDESVFPIEVEPEPYSGGDAEPVLISKRGNK